MAIVGYLGSMLYDQAFLSKDQDEQIEAQAGGHAYSYPAAVNIKNAVGREMMVTLLARSGTHIQFTRPDGEEFVYPISSLDLAAQTLISKYPNDGIKYAVASEVPEVGPQVRVKDLHISGMNERLVDLREEWRLLRYRLNAEGSIMGKRNVSHDINEIEAKISKVEWKLAEHQSFLNP